MDDGASAPSRRSNSRRSPDLTICVVGTTDEWESEGWDRGDITLPGEQDEFGSVGEPVRVQLHRDSFLACQPSPRTSSEP